MSRRVRLIGIALALQLVALVLAHDLVYLVRYGSQYGEALVHAGHGEAWSATVGTTFAIATALLVAGALRLAHLGILVRRARAGSADRIPVGSAAGALDAWQLFRLWLRLALRGALVSVVLLTLQENLERSAQGGPVPGFGILVSKEYPGALGITIAVGLLVGLIAALFEWRRRVLIERLRVARLTPARRSRATSSRPRGVAWRPTGSLLGRRSGLRAPPLPSAL